MGSNSILSANVELRVVCHCKVPARYLWLCEKCGSLPQCLQPLSPSPAVQIQTPPFSDTKCSMITCFGRSYRHFYDLTSVQLSLDGMQCCISYWSTNTIPPSLISAIAYVYILFTLTSKKHMLKANAALAVLAEGAFGE